MEDQLAQAPFREGVSGGETRRIVAPRTLRLPTYAETASVGRPKGRASRTDCLWVRVYLGNQVKFCAQAPFRAGVSGGETRSIVAPRAPSDSLKGLFLLIIAFCDSQTTYHQQTLALV